MNTYYIDYDDSIYLMHHGIKGQKWGVRRFQNANGSLTSAGKKRSGSKSDYKSTKEYQRDRKDFGRRGANRIAKNQAKGMDRKAARYYEQDRRKYGERGARRIYKKSNGKAGYTRDHAVIAESTKKFNRKARRIAVAYMLIKYGGITPARISKTAKGAVTFGKSFYKAYSRHKVADIPRIAPEMAWDPIDKKFHVV